MKKLLSKFNELLPTALLIGGAAAISCGAALVCAPLGLMSAGCFCLAGGWLMIKGGGNK